MNVRRIIRNGAFHPIDGWGQQRERDLDVNDDADDDEASANSMAT